MSRVCYLVACIAGFTLWGTHAHARNSITFESARAQGPGWTSKATTDVDLGDTSEKRLPRVSGVECYSEGPEFALVMDGATDLTMFQLQFLGKRESDGERDQITLLGDHLWLFIDGERWEYANIPARSFAFKNVEYPPPTSDIVIGVWRGHQAVRRNDTEPWINLKLIYHRLIFAKQVRWSFKSRDWTVVDRTISGNDLPSGWKSKRYDIDIRGLRGAFNWCARHVSADEAYILPEDVDSRREWQPTTNPDSPPPAFAPIDDAYGRTVTRRSPPLPRR